MNKKLFAMILSAMLILTSISGITVFADDVAEMAGSGTEADPYLITDAAHFVTISTEVNDNKNTYSDKYFRIENDIDMSSVTDFVPIGYEWNHDFRPKLIDGNNKKITNLNITVTNGRPTGLFGYSSYSTIQNLTIESGTITGNGITGAFIGDANLSNTLINCKNYATINGGGNTGGLVGRGTQTTKIENCYNAGAVTGNGNVGGIVGYIGYKSGEGWIKDSVNDGVVANQGNDLGGIVGVTENSILISNCVNNADVTTAGSTIGGISGSSKPAVIDNCVNYGDVGVSGIGYVGGISGYVSGGSSITNCVNYGEAVDGGNRIGGIAGELINSTLQYCINNADVVGTGDAGGVAGHANTAATLTDCYNLGDIAGGARGGVAGSVEGGSKIMNNYTMGTVSDNGNACIGWQSTGKFANLYYDNTKNSSDHSSAASTGMDTSAFASGEVAAMLNLNHNDYVEEAFVVTPAKVWSCDGVKPIFADENNYPAYKYVISGAADEDITIFPLVADSETVKVIVTSYTGTELTDVESQDAPANGETITLGSFNQGDSLKIMFWDSYGLAKPLTKTVY